MQHMRIYCSSLILIIALMLGSSTLEAQGLPTRYATLELFTNTPCPICGSQNPGLFSRLGNYEGEYHLISFYPGQPYSSCIFYQANTLQNAIRLQHYPGEIFGSPTVALNGLDFKSSSGVNTTVLDNLTGGTSWLHVDVEETAGTNRTVTINLEDVVGGSLSAGQLFAVIVEKEIFYNAPNGETVHHNVFRRFLTTATGDAVDLSNGAATKTYQYAVEGGWSADQTYIIAWVSDPTTKEIYNSGTRFDPDFISSVGPELSAIPVKIYPNPATSEVILSLPSGVTSADISVYDFQGREVLSLAHQTQPEVRINTENFLQGQYLIRMVGDQKVFAGEFQILRKE